MRDPIFILRSPSGRNLLSFDSKTEALKYRERVSNERSRFTIIEQTIQEREVA